MDSNGKCIPSKGVDISRCSTNATIPEGYPSPYLSRDGVNCACGNGFTYNKTNKICIIDQSLSSSFGCAKLEFKPDKQLGCVCSQSQKFDSTTRKCLNQCSDEQVKLCEQRKATCDYRNDKAACKCKLEEIAIAKNFSNLEEWTCQPRCSLLDLPENSQRRYIV